jgi:hypothetical protein
VSATKIVSIRNAEVQEASSLKDEICRLQEERMSTIRENVRQYLWFCARIGVSRVRVDELDWVAPHDRHEIAEWLRAEGFTLKRGWTNVIWVDLRCTPTQPPSEE